MSSLKADEPKVAVSLRTSLAGGDDKKPITAPAPVTIVEKDLYLTGSKLYLVLLGLGLAIFLFALDISIISTVSKRPFHPIYPVADPQS
jgi:hypothetical protein